ncbi:Os01g0235325, partial [Oryza sativa Japonica Group]
LTGGSRAWWRRGRRCRRRGRTSRRCRGSGAPRSRTRRAPSCTAASPPCRARPAGAARGGGGGRGRGARAPPWSPPPQSSLRAAACLLGEAIGGG